MAKSLQEQLLQSGAARPKQAKKARREKTAKNKAARQQGQRPNDEQALQAQVAAAASAKRERDRQLNAEQKTQREARERDHAVAQIIERNRVEASGPGEQTMVYNYTIENRIRRIEVSTTQHRDLADGRLAIVRHHDHTALVPRAVAERLEADIPDRIWRVSKRDEPEDPDDPYAAFPVPDDLMW